MKDFKINPNTLIAGALTGFMAAEMPTIFSKFLYIALGASIYLLGRTADSK